MKKKYLLKWLVWLFVPIMLIQVLSGCKILTPGSSTDLGLDANKKTIEIMVTNQGIGIEWANKIAKKYNATSVEYQILPRGSLWYPTQIVADIKSGSPTYGAYISSEASFFKSIQDGIFEDLSDLLDRKPDGENGSTVRGKMNIKNWETIASNNGSGVYMLPVHESWMGFIYDHELFLENNWLTRAAVSEKENVEEQGIVCEIEGSNLIFKSSERITNYETGDTILSAGKDGKYGTYDDGQPETVVQFDAMVKNIYNTTVPFIFSGQFSGYLNLFTTSLFAQYSGVEDFESYFAYNTNGKAVKMNDGSSKVIDIDNGRQVYEMEGLYKGIEYLYEYFGTDKYIHEGSRGSSLSHTQAQQYFITGYRGTIANNPESAMLFDGTWWENEAKVILNELGQSTPDRGFGKRDYRYMLTPNIPNQYGIDGEGHGTIYPVQGTGVVTVPKTADKAKLAAIKDFLALMLSDECMQESMVETGLPWPYKYSITNENREKISKFALNSYNLYSDTENVEMVRPFLLRDSAPIYFVNSFVTDNFYPAKFGTEILPLFRAFRKATGGQNAVEITIDALGNMYSDNQWELFLTRAKNAGYYK